MKFKSLIAGTALALSMSGTAMAQTTSAPKDMQVSVTVVPSCTFTTGNLPLPQYDPLDNQDRLVVNFGGLGVRCSAGTSWQAVADLGMNSADSKRYMKRDGGTEKLSYQLYPDNGQTTEWGEAHPIAGTSAGSQTPVYSTIVAQLRPGQDAPAGSYKDVVKVTLRY